MESSRLFRSNRDAHRNVDQPIALTNPLLLGDVNQDGAVDFFDIHPFIAVLTARTPQAETDIDGNGVVNFFEIHPFIELLNGP